MGRAASGAAVPRVNAMGIMYCCLWSVRAALSPQEERSRSQRFALGLSLGRRTGTGRLALRSADPTTQPARLENDELMQQAQDHATRKYQEEVD